MYTSVGLNHFAVRVFAMCALANNKIKRIRKITQLLFAPAIPVLIALWFSSFIGLSDAYLASKMRTPALVALGFCEPLWFLVTLLTTGLCSGISVGLAAKCSAESAPAPDSQFFLVDSLFLSAILGFILLFAALFLSIFLSYHPHWLSGTAKSVADYFRICSLSNLPFVLMQAQCAIFRATGRSRNVVLLWAVAAFIEIALSNLLVSFGFGDLNILSASWVLACFSSACLGFFLMKPLLQNFDYKAYARSSWSAHATSARSVSSIGLPVAFGELGLITSNMLNLYVISTLPEAHNFEAAWAIKTKLEEVFEIVPICAVGLTVAPFMSWHNRVRSKRVSNWAAHISFQAAMTLAFALVMLVVLVQFTSRFLASLFCVDDILLEQTAQVISFSSLAWPFFAVSYILLGALEGVRQTVLPTALHLLFALPVRLGLAVVLKDCPQFSGIAGITIAGVIAHALLALAIVALFRCKFFRCFARRAASVHPRSLGA